MQQKTLRIKKITTLLSFQSFSAFETLEESKSKEVLPLPTYPLPTSHGSDPSFRFYLETSQAGYEPTNSWSQGVRPTAAPPTLSPKKSD